MIDDAESSGEDQDEEENEDDLNDDEEDEEGFTDLEDGAPEHSENQKKTSLYKAPTAEEMEQLRRQEEERGGHFGFAMKVCSVSPGEMYADSLQINALLGSTFLDSLPKDGETYTPSPTAPVLKEILTTIHSHITAMPSLPALPVDLAAQRLAPLRIPFPSPSPLEGGRSKEIKWTLGWEAPKEVLVCGSWPVLGGYRKGRKIAGTKEVEVNGVDMGIVMPDVSLFKR